MFEWRFGYDDIYCQGISVYSALAVRQWISRGQKREEKPSRLGGPRIVTSLMLNGCKDSFLFSVPLTLYSRELRPSQGNFNLHFLSKRWFGHFQCCVLSLTSTETKTNSPKEEAVWQNTVCNDPPIFTCDHRLGVDITTTCQGSCWSEHRA